jgi:hypothetical protein
MRREHGPVPRDCDREVLVEQILVAPVTTRVAEDLVRPHVPVPTVRKPPPSAGYRRRLLWVRATVHLPPQTNMTAADWDAAASRQTRMVPLRGMSGNAYAVLAATGRRDRRGQYQDGPWSR